MKYRHLFINLSSISIESKNLKVISLHNNIYSNNIILKLRDNNREAQHQVYTFYAPKMLGVCRQYINDIHHAEEVLLNGFLKVFTKINSYNNKGSFEGWIRRIMVNECISYLRVKKNAFVTSDYKDEAIFEEEDTQEIDTTTINYLQQLVDNLKPELRIVFNLFVIEEYKHKEIAEMLSITENASKIRLRKAKQKLREQVQLKNKHYGK